jgi:hypothetical protein
MNDVKVLIVALGISLGILSAVSPRTRANAPPNVFRIEGQVETTDAIPLADVVVRMWRGGKVAGQAISDSAGHFLLAPGKGEPIEALTFEPPDMRYYGSAVVENLSGKHNQQVNIVLFDPQYFKSILQQATDRSHVDLSPLRRQASAITRLAEIESRLPNSADSDPSRFRQFVHRMRSDRALFGRQEAAEVDSYLEAVETKFARESELRGNKSGQYPAAPSSEF